MTDFKTIKIDSWGLRALAESMDKIGGIQDDEGVTITGARITIALDHGGEHTFPVSHDNAHENSYVSIRVPE